MKTPILPSLRQNARKGIEVNRSIRCFPSFLGTSFLSFASESKGRKEVHRHHHYYKNLLLFTTFVVKFT
jgi:hypothetical protein